MGRQRRTPRCPTWTLRHRRDGEWEILDEAGRAVGWFPLFTDALLGSVAPRLLGLLKRLCRRYLGDAGDSSYQECRPLQEAEELIGNVEEVLARRRNWIIGNMAPARRRGGKKGGSR